jgi:polar amino acid transport system substrate-binding protein
MRQGPLAAILSAFFVVALGPCALAAAPTLASVKAAGKIVVAVDPTYPPMESEDTSGALLGYDIDFARELATRLGVKAEFMIMGFEGIISGLASNRYDLIISCMNITPDRAKQIDFVEYAQMSELYVARKGLKVQSDKDLAGRVVAVATDTTSYDYVTKQQAAGLKIREIKAFRLTSDVFMAVKTGHADVLIVDEPVARYFARQDHATFEITGRAMAPEPVGIGVSKSSPDLKDAVQKALQAMRQDGTQKRLDERYFGGQLGLDVTAH